MVGGTRSASQRRSDWTVFGVAFGIVVFSVLLTPSVESVSLGSYVLPDLCAFRRMTGTDCLGCGLTRSFVYMGHAQWSAAFESHWLGPLGWSLVAFQLPWRSFSIWRGAS